MKYLAPALMALVVGACAPDAAPADDGLSSPAPSPTMAGTPPADPVGAVPDRVFRYTSLENCRELRRETEEMPFVEQLCPGLGGYTLKVSESDLRQNVTVVSPGGSETSLDLSATGSGGFSTLGPQVEWRGSASGGEFVPDALIMRYQVAEAPAPAGEVSYLLAARLRPSPCVVAKIAPEAAQNSKARTRADAGGACLTR